jgi:RNA polymerase sigma-70 factor (ECF subfamily)
MQRHGPSVYRYCREALRDRALAEDVQQQVLIAVFRDPRKFSARSTVRTWLFAIARHRVLDAVESRRRARSHVDGETRPSSRTRGHRPASASMTCGGARCSSPA